MNISGYKRTVSFFSESWDHFISLRPTRMASSLSYYGLFSLVPILVITSWIGSALFDNRVLSSEILEQVASLIGSQSTMFIQTTFANASSLGDHPLRELFAISILVALAVTGIAELKSGLDDIWQTPYKRPETVIAWLSKYFMPSLATILFGIVFAVFIIIVKFVQAGFTFGFSPETLSFVGSIAAPLLVFLITTTGTFIAYTILPERKIPAGKIFFGAVFTGLFLTLGNIALGFYLTHGATLSTYGVAGSIIAVLLWFYYSALIFLFGASATWTYYERSIISRDN